MMTTAASAASVFFADTVVPAKDETPNQGMYGQLRYTKDSLGNVEQGLVTRSDKRKVIAEGADPDSQ